MSWIWSKSRVLTYIFIRKGLKVQFNTLTRVLDALCTSLRALWTLERRRRPMDGESKEKRLIGIWSKGRSQTARVNDRFWFSLSIKVTLLSSQADYFYYLIPKIIHVRGDIGDDWNYAFWRWRMTSGIGTAWRPDKIRIQNGFPEGWRADVLHSASDTRDPGWAWTIASKCGIHESLHAANG